MSWTTWGKAPRFLRPAASAPYRAASSEHDAAVVSPRSLATSWPQSLEKCPGVWRSVENCSGRPGHMSASGEHVAERAENIYDI